MVSRRGALGNGPRSGQRKVFGEFHIKSRERWISTPQVREKSLMSREKKDRAERSIRKSRVWATMRPMLGLPKTIRPRGLSMMSGSMEPKARKARLTWFKRRAEARARPTWAKRSTGEKIAFLGI